MNTKVYIANLVAVTTESELRVLFAPYGNVMDVSIPVDRASGRACGFGYVTMATPEGARAAIQGLNGKVMGTCKLDVSELWPHAQRSSPPRSH